MHTEISQKEDCRHGQSRQLLHFLDKETIKLRGIDRTKKFRFEYLVVIVQSPSSVRLCDPMDHSKPGFPVPHHLLEFIKDMNLGTSLVRNLNEVWAWVVN